MNVSFREAARDDVIRQFRYYLVESEVPEVAVRFREAVRQTVDSLRRHPFIGSRIRSANRSLEDVRSWPVAGFEAIRIYYQVADDTLEVVRILHGKRDVERVIQQDLR